MPRLVIAGTHSGVGKTTLSLQLMKAFSSTGLTVQGFKTGPDYVDPKGYLGVTGRPGRNLDTWLMSPSTVLSAFAHGAAGADIAVIEGVMGLFDGALGGGELGSTAYLAKLLQAPVVLVLDARASARSAAAVALGFRSFDPSVALAGVICNFVGSEGHAQMLAEALASIDVPMLAAVQRDGQLSVTSSFLSLADTAPALPVSSPLFSPESADRFAGLRLAVAQDNAFGCMYPETLELLRHWGVELAFFSPLASASLPPGVDALFLGGGYPERFAAALAANVGLLEQLRSRIAAGLPVFAEGGGYVYLLDALDGHRLVGALPGQAHSFERLQAMGYRQASPSGVKGHLFQYTRIEGDLGPPAYQLYRANGDFERADGVAAAGLFASYLQLHHATEPGVLFSFLERVSVRERKTNR